MIFRRFGERGGGEVPPMPPEQDRQEKEQALARLRRDRDGIKQFMVGGKDQYRDADRLDQLRHRIDALRHELGITEEEKEWSAEEWQENEA